MFLPGLINFAPGLSREGWNITKNLFAEITILTLGFFIGILDSSIQEFCLLAVMGLLSDFFLQVRFAKMLNVCPCQCTAKVLCLFLLSDLLLHHRLVHGHEQEGADREASCAKEKGSLPASNLG